MLMAQIQSCFNCHMFYKEYLNKYVLGQQNTQQLRIYNFFNFVLQRIKPHPIKCEHKTSYNSNLLLKSYKIEVSTL